MPKFLNSTLENRGKKYRDKLEIVRDMLLAASVETRKTRIMYQANLSQQLLEKYLTSLLASELIQCNEGIHYLVTRKGKHFLQMYDDYLGRCQRISEDIEGAGKDRIRLEDMCFNNNARAGGLNE